MGCIAYCHQFADICLLTFVCGCCRWLLQMEEGEVFEPRKNNVVACLHDDTSGGEGQAWLRAKIEDVVDGNANVLFIDYGHR